MQELENENDKLKREVAKLMASIAATTDFDTDAELTPSGNEFLGKNPIRIEFSIYPMDTAHQGSTTTPALGCSSVRIELGLV